MSCRTYVRNGIEEFLNKITSQCNKYGKKIRKNVQESIVSFTWSRKDGVLIAEEEVKFNRGGLRITNQ